MQMGLMLGRGTIDAIFALLQIMEKHEVARIKLYIVLVDLERLFIISKKGKQASLRYR